MAMLGDAPFTGRERQLAELDQAAASVAGHGALVLVLGEPGIGKTRLVEEWLARSAGSRVIWTACWEDIGQPPYWVWRTVAQGLGADVTDGSRYEQHEVLLSTLRGLAEPVTVVVDDLHWADAESLAGLAHLARHFRELPGLLIIGTYRDTDVVKGSAFAVSLPTLSRQAAHIAVPALDAGAVQQLLTSAGGPAELAEEVLRRTAGNALFVTELARQSGNGNLSAVPARLAAVLAERFEAVGPARPALEAAAVLGLVSSLVDVAAVVGADVPEVLELLSPAVQLGLVAEQGHELAFRHALVRDSLLAELPGARRLELEAASASVLLARGGEATRTAAHSLAGAALLPPADVVEACRRASAEALRAAAPLPAVAHLDNALRVLSSALPPLPVELTIRVRLELGSAWARAGDLQQALAAFVEAEQLGARHGMQHLQAEAVSAQSSVLPAYVPRPDLVVRLRQLADELPAGSAQADGLLALSWARRTASGQPDQEGERWAAEAVLRAEQRLDDQCLALLLPVQLQLARCDRVVDQRAVIGKLSALATRTNDVDAEATVAHAQLSVALLTGDLLLAQGSVERIGALATRAGSVYLRAVHLARKATLLHVTGHLDEALEQIEEVEALALVAGLPEFVPSSACLRLQIHHDAGRPPPESAVAVLHERDAPLLRSGGGMLAVRARQELGLLGELEWRALIADLPSSPAALLYNGLSCLVVAAEVAVQRADREAGQDLLARLRGSEDLVASVAGAVASVGPVALAMAELAGLVDQESDAAQLTAVATALADRLRAPVWRARATRGGPGPLLRRVENGWEASVPEGVVHLRDGKGLSYLAELISRPGQELAALDLLRAVDGGPRDERHDLGAALDGAAKAAYRRRLAELRRHAEQADERGDAAASERAFGELEAITRELARAVGLGGRDRPVGSASERARLNVTRALRSAIERLRESAPASAAVLDADVHTGGWCSYRPTAQAWRTERS